MSLSNAADEKKHELHNVLAKAFITPIEREDMVLLSQSIDELTDEIEDVLLRIYCNNVKSIRPRRPGPGERADPLLRGSKKPGDGVRGL